MMTPEWTTAQLQELIADLRAEAAIWNESQHTVAGPATAKLMVSAVSALESLLAARAALEKIKTMADNHIGSGGFEGPDHRMGFTNAVFQISRAALPPGEQK